MAQRFTDKVALVTGASSGIGQDVAVAFGNEGARVVVADISIDGGQQTVEMITGKGGEATFVQTDVSRAGDVESAVETAVSEFGGLDLAVNNAGIEGMLLPTADYPEDEFDKVIAINMKGVWLGMKYQIPKMIGTGGGAIVNMASILGLVAFGTAGAYVAAKHAVVGLTKTAALEYAQSDVRINAVCPGFIETPMVMERGVKAGSDAEAYAQLQAAHPMGRLGRPEEITEMVTFLCSPAASFVTGAAFPVDGGYVAQ
jgi:NAD(P)-dependent dehydrogenase (short-subunit alcohol dehydrogenase family)